ncbi:ribonuclease P protein component [Selenomonas sp. oral taxon 920]|uniref:ribonuclease P protein component n=1 Tax=Selenomonas sp. oral taxon 920 TaxID=1884263 RepID=UPI000840F8A9|nr:ribonuclease P protein component [Selenomonas sp. oral taxon 920]AOH46945.1 ribonuclease P protein component [Selenomonas sp. oral taxon 920]
MNEKKYTLPRTKMIKRRSDFQHVYQKGTSVAGRRMILYVLRDSRVAGKVGFAAGKKLGCAAVRSRTKRLLREAYRHLQHELRKDVGILLIGRAGLAAGKMQDAAIELRTLARRAKIFADARGESRTGEHR